MTQLGNQRNLHRWVMHNYDFVGLAGVASAYKFVMHDFVGLTF